MSGSFERYEMNETEKIEVSVNFLIAEFNALQQRATTLEQVKSSQLNFFLLVVAATAAGLASLAGNAAFASYLPASFLFAFLFVFLLGVATLLQSVNYSVSIISFYRRAGRIRRWFVDFHQDIARYIAFQANDDRPPYKIMRSHIAARGGDAVLLMVNAASFAGVTASLAIILFKTELTGALVGGGLSGVAIWLIQYRLVQMQLSAEEQRKAEHVRFPYKPVSLPAAGANPEAKVTDASNTKQAEPGKS
jgi:hypothetical protein